VSRRTTVLAAALLLAPGASAAEPLQVEVKRHPHDAAWTRRATWTLAHAAGFDPQVEPPKLGPYGGDATRQVGATGFFHTKRLGERWWLVDPDGHPFLHVAVGSVAPTIGSDPARAAFARKYGSPERWAAEATAQLRAHGFNGSGSWSRDTLLRQAPERLAYCPNWNFMSSYGKKRGGTFQKPGHTGYPNDAIFVFDPEFETFAMEHAKQLAATKDDP
jgi:hypothetical protein